MPVINTEIAETVEITSNGMHDVAKYTSANVAVPKVINSLNVTPTTSAQTITATGGVDGYSPVNVSAVTSSIDANITAGNIKDGVTILGVTGNYQGGGGGGELTMQFRNSSGTLLRPNSVMDLTGITTIPSNGLYGAYYNDNYLTSAIDWSSITTISGQCAFEKCFCSCIFIPSIDLSGITTLNDYGVFLEAFYACYGLNHIDFSGLTSIGEYAQECFTSAFFGSPFSNGVDFSALQSVAAPNAFWQAFDSCGFSSIEFPSLTSITGSYAFGAAFTGCSNLTSVSFPALTSDFLGSSYNYQFMSMLENTENVTVHFPSNLQSVIGSEQDVIDGFGGTNTTVLFDLPATE